MEVPYLFIRLIGRKLMAAGLVEGRKGRGGGLRLKVDPKRLSLLKVARAVAPEGLKLNSCLVRGTSCSLHRRCPVHTQLHGLQDQIDKALDGIRFDKLAEDSAAGGR
jgi:DNA-binding IscR family transcriptional regulator